MLNMLNKLNKLNMLNKLNKTKMIRMNRMLVLAFLLLTSCATAPTAFARAGQPSFETAYANLEALQKTLSTFEPGGRAEKINWHSDNTIVSYTVGDERFKLNLREMTVEPIGEFDDLPTQRQREGRRNPARGRQRAQETSPDGRYTALCIDWNVVIRNNETPDDYHVTTDGHRKLRYGTASWVYGEELDQIEAMWWSPDSSLLAFYRFDESDVPDFYLLGDLTTNHTTLMTEGYPKPGEPNPAASLLVFDTATREIIDIRTSTGEEQYIYNVRFTPIGDALLFNRTNRHQNVLELVRADPVTGVSRTIVTETQETWQNNRPDMTFLNDGRRFIWETEKSGWAQYELRNLDGQRLYELTGGSYPVAGIVRVDEEAGWLYYYAYSDANPLNRQLHRVRLDGTGQQRLTQESMYHTVSMSPDAKWFLTTCESVSTPPVTVLYDTFGKRIRTIAEGSNDELAQARVTPSELFTVKADDGVTDLYGVLHFPPNFDPAMSYPLILNVYGGPGVNTVRNTYQPGRSDAGLGCLVASIDNRGTPNRGKAFEGATYLKLGTVDLADQVAGVRALAKRPYIDGSRIGIVGHSYGGYLSALAMVKYPGVFAAAVARAAVTDWRQYDTIYTERYMRTPAENEIGYEEGSCITFADQLEGELLIMHGLVDDNVHPTNAWQFIDALDRANKFYESRFMPRRGHSFAERAYHLRFLYRALWDREAS
jgi:dipeptidyl-peptidase-4